MNNTGYGYPLSPVIPFWSRRLFVLALVATMAGWLTACSTTAPPGANSLKSAWALFSDAAGGFSVLMPMAPHEAVQAYPSANGLVVKSHEFIVDPNPTVELGVIYNDFPESLPNIWVLGSPSFFDTVQETALKRLGDGRLIFARDGLFASHPMREFQFQVPDKKLVYQTRIIVVGHRMYQLIVVSSGEVDASHEVKTLFNSFHLL